MKNEQCPICYHELEVIGCAPCHDCGNLKEEIEHFKQGMHHYTIYNVYKGLQLKLCDFCEVDFGSYNPTFLGLKYNQRLGFGEFEFVREVKSPTLEKDKYCPACHRRLKFLKFLSAIRAMNQEE